MTGFLIAGLVIALIIGIVGGIWWLGKKRQEALVAIATDLGLTFYPKGDSSLSALLTQLDFFSYGKYRRVRNLIKGTIQQSGRDITVAIFDYYYTIGRGDNTDTFGQTVLLLYDETLQVPSFSLRPEHIFDKLGNLLGAEDINFPDAPTFSKRYRLQGNPAHLVRSLFQPNLLKFYEREKVCSEAKSSTVAIFPSDDGNPLSKSIRIQNSKTFTESRLMQPKEFKTFLNTGLRLLSLLRQNSK